jgi:hypothetical protein
MAAITRWVQYNVSSTGTAQLGGGTEAGRGTRGLIIAESTTTGHFNIGSNNNRLYIGIDGDDPALNYITIASGSELDPRFVAKDITEKLHNLGKSTEGWDRAQCVWENNKFCIYSGGLGSASSVVVTSGTNTAHLELGFGMTTTQGGLATANSAVGGITVSGTYRGFFDEIYRIIVNKEINIMTPVIGGGNSYTGQITAGGSFNYGSAVTYTLSISTANGRSMGGSIDTVPTMSWTSTGDVDNGGPVALVYPDFWYKVGTKGLMVKFTDAQFDTINPAWTIECKAVTQAVNGSSSAPLGTAQYIYGSSRGDDADAAITTSDGGFTKLGSRGLSIRFDVSTNLTAGDEFYVVCSPPQPQSYDITSLNYGNVTVSTESPLRIVMFEILSGAVEIDTVKFGLQSHGTFQHHDAGNNDTKMRFGTLGPGNNAGVYPSNGYEWWPSATAADISSDTNPSYFYSTREDLAVVSDADNSQTIGTSADAGMCADPIWLNIKLGASEVGANSTINYRIYFDYI